MLGIDLVAARGAVRREQLLAAADAAGGQLVAAEAPGARAEPAEVLDRVADLQSSQSSIARTPDSSKSTLPTR